MVAKAENLEVRSIENCGDYPRVEIHANVIIGNPGEVEKIETEQIRLAIENACACNVKIRTIGKRGEV